MRRLRADRACAAAVALLWLVGGATCVQAYGIRVRWQHEVDANVSGYRVHVWPDSGAADPPHDVGVPSEDHDGTLSAVVTDMAPGVGYSIAVSACFADGSETALSNVLRVTYPDVAPSVDSDGDGLVDAVDQCPNSPTGAAVGPSGCACEELRCDDGDPCNGTETCSAGVCMPGTSAGVSLADLTIQRFFLRPIRRGRAWQFTAFATMAPGDGALVPSSAMVEVWSSGADLHYFASVASDRFAPRRNRLRFFAANEGAVGGLRRLEIVDRGGLRTVWVQAIVPATAIPAATGSQLSWVVRFGDMCARALEVTCGPVGRRFTCR